LKGALRDLGELLRGDREPDLPPHRLRFVGAGEFRAAGLELASLLVDCGRLAPSDRVLDLGCGVGRVAIPLGEIVRPPGSYEGLDPVASAIRWCRRRISSRHPHFRFRRLDVFNALYNRRGAPATDVTLPFEDESFTFAFAISLFTHLGATETNHYLAELMRVCRPGARLLATFFVLEEGDPSRDIAFALRRDGDWTSSAECPAEAIAFERDALESLLEANGWVVARFEKGRWAGRPEAPCYQDVVVAERPAPAPGDPS